MYFHGQAPGGQKTGIATSKDGLTFAAQDLILGEFYFRVFKWQDWFYSFAKTDWGGLLARSKDGVTPFESRVIIVPPSAAYSISMNVTFVRSSPASDCATVCAPHIATSVAKSWK